VRQREIGARQSEQGSQVEPLSCSIRPMVNLQLDPLAIPTHLFGFSRVYCHVYSSHFFALFVSTPFLKQYC